MNKLKVFAFALLLVAGLGSLRAQKWGSTPEDSVQCIMNTSLYGESYKMKDYIGAYEPWHQVVQSCPKSSKNLYIRGVTILKAKINAATSAEERESYIQELIDLYDIRVANGFGDAGEMMGRKAMDVEGIVGVDHVDRYYPIYAEAMRVGGDNIDAVYAYKFFEATINYVVRGFAEPTLVIDNYDLASDVLDKEYREALSDTAKAADIAKYIANVEAAFSPYASCDQLVSIYTKKFEANPDDLDLLKKITNIMKKKGCTDQELFFKATEKLHALEPSPSSAFLMGQMCYNTKKYSKAVDYLNEALKGLDDSRDIYRCYLALGLSYTELDSYSSARNAYNKAAEVDPTKGEPYIMIAALYASSARSIPDDMGGASAFWAAVDAANRAKAVDPSESTAEQANKLIRTYSAYFPKQDKAFFLDLVDGQGYTVPGWIGVHTVVRTRK